jgi:uncharacterized protein YgbK (DUF1537 family)
LAVYAILADDLTGAGDAGVQFAAAGLRTRTLFGAWTPPDLHGADVVVIDTASRPLPPDAAYAAVHAAALRVQAAGAAVIYKKIDSTLRGPLGAEIAAVLAACRLPLAVICPAYPALGRSVRGGVLMVERVPVAFTPAGADPQAPVRESHLPTLLGGSLPAPSAPTDVPAAVRWLARPEGGHRRDLLASQFHAIAAAGGAGFGASPNTLVVCDAEDDADLAAIVAAARTLDAALLVGSAGMARPLAALLGAHAPTPGEWSILVLCGSVHPAARAQLAAVGALGHPQVQVLATPAHAPVAAQEPVTLLAAAARAWLEAHRPAGMVVTGGDTLHAFLHALDAHGVDLEREVAPGMPLGRIAHGPWRGLPLISKAGGFGGPDALADAALLLLDLHRRAHERNQDNGPCPHYPG